MKKIFNFIIPLFLICNSATNVNAQPPDWAESGKAFYRCPNGATRFNLFGVFGLKLLEARDRGVEISPSEIIETLGATERPEQLSGKVTRISFILFDGQDSIAGSGGLEFVDGKFSTLHVHLGS